MTSKIKFDKTNSLKTGKIFEKKNIEDTAKGTFIPFRRSDVVTMCLDDGKLDEEHRPKFKTFCELITAYYHFSFHSILERMKDFFLPTDPDTIYRTIDQESGETSAKKEQTFFNDFECLLKRANFRSLNEEELKQAFQDRSLIQLNIEVDFDAFEHYLFYYRGSRTVTTRKKLFPFFYKEVTFDMFDRVIVLLKFKGKEYFQKKGMKIEQLNFVPGRTYIYYFKNIPKADLEILFPNVKISMTMKDRLLFLVPCIGVGISTLFKIWGQFFILIAFILILLGWISFAETIAGQNAEMIQDKLFPVIAAIATIAITLGGFAIKQYMNYKNKWVEFLNDVTQTLFFRNLSVNAGVFQCMIDSAEEEECKEAILAYYHLLTSDQTLSKPELDKKIERWFQEKFHTHLDFDVEDALQKLESLKGKIQEGEKVEERNLIRRDENGKLKVESLDHSIVILDSIWDNLFQFNDFLVLDKEKNREPQSQFQC